MPDKTPITSPGKYVTPTAVGFANSHGELALVTNDAPLPVIITNRGGGDSTIITPPTPLAGQATQSVVVGPFTPNPNLPIHLQLSGQWKGTVALERSTDGGKTRQGLTIGGARWASFSGNVNEPVWQEVEAGASFWLNIQLESGEITYRVSQ